MPAVLSFFGLTMVYRFTPGSTDGPKLKEDAGCGFLADSPFWFKSACSRSDTY